MSYMIDGSASLEGKERLAAVPSPDRLNEVFMGQNLIGYRLALVHDFCVRAERRLLEIINLVQNRLFGPAGWSLNFHFRKSDEFNAGAALLFGAERDYIIDVSIAAPAVLLSVAAELHACRLDDAPHGDGGKRVRLNSVEHWLSSNDDSEELPSEVIQLALDATALLFFHEIAHVIFGHCNIEVESHDERRALELDADFNAGSIFALWTPYLQEGCHTEEIVQRLIHSGFLLGTIFKVCSGRSASYHYPTTRMKCFISGGIFALSSGGNVRNFDNVADGDEYWSEQVDQHSKALLTALRKSSLSYYAGTEQDLVEDEYAWRHVSIPVRDRLKDGLLKPYQLKRA